MADEKEASGRTEPDHQHAYDVLIGPFYSAAAVRHLLGDVSGEALRSRVRRGSTLEVRTSDGLRLYPQFQFCDRRIDPAIGEVLSAFRDTPVDGWAIATWFSLPHDELDNQSPREWLSQPSADLLVVLHLARQTAHRWTAP